MSDEWIHRLDLDEPSIATASVADCTVDLRRQRSSSDLWIMVSGPLGRWPALGLPHEAMVLRRERGPLPVRGTSLRGDTVELRVDDEFTLRLRPRGRRLAIAYLYSGVPFGGADVGLPSRRGRTPWQRVVDRFRGRRGDGVSFTTHAAGHMDRDG